MKKFLNAVIVLIASHSINIISQDEVEEIVVTSAFIDTSEINNPLYIIDGTEFSDGATTSLGDAIDEYLGVQLQTMVQLLANQLLEVCQAQE